MCPGLVFHVVRMQTNKRGGDNAFVKLIDGALCFAKPNFLQHRGLNVQCDLTGYRTSLDNAVDECRHTVPMARLTSRYNTTCH